MTKNIFFILALAVTACIAEPPRYRQRTFARQEAEVVAVTSTTEQEAEGTTESVTPYAAAGAPYSPSGWKPAGRLLAFPARQQVQQVYGVPSLVYGSATKPTDPEVNPDDDVETQASEGTEGNETTDEPESEILPSSQQTQNVPSTTSSKQEGTPGAYFIQLPDGSVQQVIYYTSGNPLVAAKLQAQPILQAQPVYFNPLLAPRTVSYSSQYQSW